MCRIFVVSNAYKKKLFLKDALWWGGYPPELAWWGGGGTHRSWPGGRGGRPRKGWLGRKSTTHRAGLVDGGSGRRGKGSGGGCKGFGSGGVGGRGTGPRDGANFATCVIFVVAKKKKNGFF